MATWFLPLELHWNCCLPTTTDYLIGKSKEQSLLLISLNHATACDAVDHTFVLKFSYVSDSPPTSLITHSLSVHGLFFLPSTLNYLPTLPENLFHNHVCYQLLYGNDSQLYDLQLPCLQWASDCYIHPPLRHGLMCVPKSLKSVMSILIPHSLLFTIQPVCSLCCPFQLNTTFSPTI